MIFIRGEGVVQYISAVGKNGKEEKIMMGVGGAASTPWIHKS